MVGAAYPWFVSEPDMADVTDVLPLALSSPTAVRESWTNTDVSYEWALGGLPFLSAASREYMLRRGFAQQRKEQVDVSGEPGEQTFSTWWVRSQSDFSGGAGRDVLDPGGDKNAMTQFRSSQGVNPWEGTDVTLLNATAKQAGTSGSAEVVVPWSTGSLVYASATAVAVYPTGGSAVASGNVNDVCVLSGKAVLAQQDSKLTTFNGTTISAWLTAPGAVLRCWSVKQRVIAAVGTSVYEVGLGAGAWPSALTDGGTNWTWTGAAETGEQILLAGHDGLRSVVYGVTVSATSGSLPTLTAPAVVAEFPPGELVTSMVSYLGNFIVFGTSKGIRVATVNDRGQLKYGAVTLETASAVKAITVADRFAYCGVTGGQPDGKSCLVRVDLSTPIDDAGRFAYANDLACDVSSTITSVTQLGTSGKMAFCANGAYIEGSTKVTSGWIETGQVRFATLEDKFFDLFKLRGIPNGGAISVESVDYADVRTGLGSMGDNSAPTMEMFVYPQTAQVRLGFRITLTSDGSQNPKLYSWQVKALPGVQREELWEIPLLCFDEEQDRYGVRTSAGSAHERYTDLRAVAASGARIMVQDLTSSESILGVVENVRFDQRKPPARTSGFGGIITVTVRTLQ